MTAPRARNCAEVAALLGIHELPRRRTMESAQQELRDYYEEHGQRPRHEDVAPLAQWLYSRGASLREVCDELGIPPRRTPRTMESARQELRDYYEEHGQRPRHEDVAALVEWLRCRGTLLGEMCDELGIPARRKATRKWTLQSARQEVQAFYNEHGKRPTTRIMPSLARWVRRNLDMTFRAFCDELRLPRNRKYGRTMEGARQEIQAYYDTHGGRPHERQMVALAQWLKMKGTSLRKLCDEMRLPGGLRTSLTREGTS